jgi:acyl-CoA reductase-like NAD-dependent aldehyde dehydrogenase
VVNVLTEDGGDAARHVVASERVRVISFTGSTAVGRRIAAEAAPTLKRVGLELGGKTPLMVFPGADLESVVPTLARAATMMNGQFCSTGSRVLVHRDIADTVRTALVDALTRVRLGAYDDPAAELGPLVDAAAADRVDAIVEEAATYGTVLVRGGKVTTGPLAASGAFYRPSLVEVQDTGARIVQEEVFGPVQTFEVFHDEADAVTRANATPYGLAASVFTPDPLQARRVGRETHVGGFWINTWGLLSEHFEQVGVKMSGYGPLCGPKAIEEFQTLKTYAELDPTRAAG